MNTFCDWLSETVISVYDSFFRNYISIVLLSSAANHSVCSYRYVATPCQPVFCTGIFESGPKLDGSHCAINLKIAKIFRPQVAHDHKNVVSYEFGKYSVIENKI